MTVLRRWPWSPQQAALVLDFDGTLAPIVEHPPDARMPARAARLVAVLAEQLDTVAILSGRPAAFLQAHAAVPGVQLVGLYGMERVVDDRVEVMPAAARHADAVAAARVDLTAGAADLPGVFVEDKGLTVALHWRNAAPPAQRSAALLATDTAAVFGLHIEAGKRVAELRPPVVCDKGHAVADLVGDQTEVAYAGDDLGDLAAFAVVAEHAGGLCVAVDHGRETPADLLERADVIVQGTEGLADWLALVADRFA